MIEEEQNQEDFFTRPSYSKGLECLAERSLGG